MIEPKKLYQNGQLVGEVPAAKSDDEQMKLAIGLLKEKGLYKPITKIQAMFWKAVSFATVSSDIYKRDLTKIPRKPMSFAPFIVNSVFAIELYLKTLGELHNSSLRGHDLLKLFDALPEAARKAIPSHFSSAKLQCGIDTIDKYRSSLEGMRLAFIKWRYSYENENTGEVKIPQMIFVMEVLHNTCLTFNEVRQAKTEHNAN